MTVRKRITPIKTSAGKPEKEVLRECLDFLKIHGILHWRQNSGAFKTESGGFFNATGMKGVSDIIGCLPDGKFLAVECKRGTGGMISQKQREFLAAVADNNGVAIVANGVEKLESELRKRGYLNGGRKK